MHSMARILDLPSLWYRRHRNDIIQNFKIINDIDDINMKSFWNLVIIVVLEIFIANYIFNMLYYVMLCYYVILYYVIL